MSKREYNHAAMLRLIQAAMSDQGDQHRESIDKLLKIIEELSYMPNAYSGTLVKHAVQKFVNNFDRCQRKHDAEKKANTFPVNVMYLHENRNMIGKTILTQGDLDELEESTFVKAYWEVRSIGDAIRCLLQASDLDANPVALYELYKDWELEAVVAVLDDKDFSKHVMIKATEWENKAEEIKKEENKLLSLMNSFFGGNSNA